MLSKIRPCLKEEANFFFSRFLREPATLQNIRDIFNGAVTRHDGVALLEGWHGNYRFPVFVQSLLGDAAQRGVTTIYLEFAPSFKQDALDKWQDSGDETDIVDYLNTQYWGFSKRQWQHYWHVMKAANAAGIRVVGVDNEHIRSGYGASFDAPFKTMHWESIILKDRGARKDTGKFLVYGGELHGIDMGGDLRGIHQRLNIPRLMMVTGAYSVARLPFDRHESHIIAFPDLPYQDEYSKNRNIRNVPVHYPLPGEDRPSP